MKTSLAKALNVAFILCLAIFIGACSANGNNASGGNAAQTTESPAPTEAPTASPEAAKFPRTIKDATGEVTIEQEPKKVAVVHWGYTDSLLIFDVASLAVALPFTEAQSSLKTEPYKSYADKLDELVVVGENTEVNLEALLAYEPDIIIAGSATNEKVIDQLKQIGTTVVLDETQTDVFSNWEPVVTKFGEILGQEEQAADFITGFQQQVASAKEKLANVEGTVAFTQVRADVVWLSGTKYISRYYEDLGLKAPESEAMEEGVQLSLEGLSEINPDHLFLGYFNRADTSLPAATDEWEKSAVWEQLNAVQKEQVYGIDGSIALAYGPLSHVYGIEEIVKALQ